MRRPQRASRGSASLELVGMLPMMLLIAVITMQVGADIYTAVSAQSAARAAARAASLRQDATAAAAASLPTGVTLDAVSVTGPGHSVRITVTAPRLAPMPAYVVTREATLP